MNNVKYNQWFAIGEIIKIDVVNGKKVGFQLMIEPDHVEDIILTVEYGEVESIQIGKIVRASGIRRTTRSKEKGFCEEIILTNI